MVGGKCMISSPPYERDGIEIKVLRQVESPLTVEEERDGVRHSRHPDRTSSWISRPRCWTAVFVRGAAANTGDDGAVFDG